MLPPGSTSLESLGRVVTLFSKEDVSQWKRSDIAGLLVAAYALLLKASPLSLSTPRGATAGNDIRKFFRGSMEAPSKLCSFSFGRICLIPALQSMSSNGQGLCYTRAKWEQDAEDNLRLRQKEQEEQQAFGGQFGSLSTDGGPQSIPTAVNLLARPDCMDDVMVFATAVCALGPEYALSFWTINSTGDTPFLSPSRLLSDLTALQAADDSLRPSYLSFLAALAIASSPQIETSGASVIHQMISSLQSPWAESVDILRWYARELNPDDTQSRTSSNAAMGNGSSSAYYYFADGDDGRFDDRSKEGQARSKPRELGDENTFILLSHLTLVANVASNSPEARLVILSINLPIESRDGRDTVGQDSTMAVLFALSVRALSPHVRGEVFRTIAALLSTDGLVGEQLGRIHEVALEAWEKLEDCQIIPISLLEQFASLREPDQQATAPMAFPPLNTSTVRFLFLLIMLFWLTLCF